MKHQSAVATLAFALILLAPGGVEGADTVPFGKHVDAKFKSKVAAIATRLGAETDHLMTVMAIETSKYENNKVTYTFSPSIKNPNSSAVGLIQFIESTAKGLGTSTAKLAKMTAVAQLDYVEKYFKPYKGKIASVADVYLAVFYPKAMGKKDAYTLPDWAYQANKGLDKDKNGKLTRGEIAAYVKGKLETGRKKAHVG